MSNKPDPKWLEARKAELAQKKEYINSRDTQEILQACFHRDISQHNGFLYYIPPELLISGMEERTPSLELTNFKGMPHWSIHSSGYKDWLLKRGQNRPGGYNIDLVMAIRFQSFDSRYFAQAVEFASTALGMSTYTGIVEPSKSYSEGGERPDYSEYTFKRRLTDPKLRKYAIDVRRIYPEVVDHFLGEGVRTGTYADGNSFEQHVIAYYNRSGGAAIRGLPNPKAKTEKGKKGAKLTVNQGDISLWCNGEFRSDDITPASDTLVIFEGFFNHLSWVCWNNYRNYVEGKPLDFGLGKDVVVLNSTSNTHFCLDLLQNYKKVELYLDNDISGRNSIIQIAEERRRQKELEIPFTSSDVQAVVNSVWNRVYAGFEKARADILSRHTFESDEQKAAYVFSYEETMEFNDSCRRILDYLHMPRADFQNGLAGVRHFLSTFTPDNIWSRSGVHNMKPDVNVALYRKLLAEKRHGLDIALSSYSEKLGLFSYSEKTLEGYNDFNEKWASVIFPEVEKLRLARISGGAQGPGIQPSEMLRAFDQVSRGQDESIIIRDKETETMNTIANDYKPTSEMMKSFGNVNWEGLSKLLANTPNSDTIPQNVGDMVSAARGNRFVLEALAAAAECKKPEVFIQALSAFFGSAPEQSKDGAEVYYRPCPYEAGEQTIAKLRELPWNELSKVMGLNTDLDMFISEQQWYGQGVLEAFAFGGYCTRPIPCFFQFGHEKPEVHFMQYRFWHPAPNEKGVVHWQFERTVDLVNNVGYKMVPRNDYTFVIPTNYTRRDLVEKATLNFRGNPLSKPVMDELRETGRLSHPIDPKTGLMYTNYTFLDRTNSADGEQGVMHEVKIAMNGDLMLDGVKAMGAEKIDSLQIIQLASADRNRILAQSVRSVRAYREALPFFLDRKGQLYEFTERDKISLSYGGDINMNIGGTTVHGHYDIEHGQVVLGPSVEEIRRERITARQEEARKEGIEFRVGESQSKGFGL